MYTITVNIYKNNQIKWQEQVLLNASSKAEAKQKNLTDRMKYAFYLNLEQLKKKGFE